VAPAEQTATAPLLEPDVDPDDDALDDADEDPPDDAEVDPDDDPDTDPPDDPEDCPESGPPDDDPLGGLESESPLASVSLSPAPVLAWSSRPLVLKRIEHDAVPPSQKTRLPIPAYAAPRTGETLLLTF
jgi:hypothetical protein